MCGISLFGGTLVFLQKAQMHIYPHDLAPGHSFLFARFLLDFIPFASRALASSFQASLELYCWKPITEIHLTCLPSFRASSLTNALSNVETKQNVENLS
mmetsp:Transcript_3894/g.6345  ORF Transcript_3894/g.6345 Transcript_3894/m.6345 type:complete len:99 (-) Transcript_3894:27-323(-)